MGYRKDVREVIEGLDLLVLPSLYEGLPLVAAEAQAMGKPVIATNVDGNPEVVINNKTGLVIPLRSPQALKEAIKVFLNNRELGVQMGKEGRKHVEANFNIKKQITQTQRLYGELCGIHSFRASHIGYRV